MDLVGTLGIHFTKSPRRITVQVHGQILIVYLPIEKRYTEHIKHIRV